MKGMITHEMERCLRTVSTLRSAGVSSAYMD